MNKKKSSHDMFEVFAQEEDGQSLPNGDGKNSKLTPEGKKPRIRGLKNAFHHNLKMRKDEDNQS